MLVCPHCGGSIYQPPRGQTKAYIEMLRDGPKTASELGAALGGIPTALVARDMARLRKDGRVERDILNAAGRIGGIRALYRLSANALPTPADGEGGAG